MGRRVLLRPTDTPVTVPGGGTATLPVDESPAFFPADPSGHQGTKRRVRIGVVFDDTPPSTGEFFLRIVDTVEGQDVAVGAPEPTALQPGTGNATPAGVWQIEGPIPSTSFLRFVNDDNTDHTLIRVLALWEDV